MSDPIFDFGFGFLLAALLVIGAKALARTWLFRFARKRLQSAAPNLMAEIEADMGELHAQIAVATRRLETSVEQMKSRTSTQLSEIGKSSEAIARLKGEFAERSNALAALADKERALHAQLRLTEAELAARSTVLADVERKLAQEKAELDNLLAFAQVRDKVAESEKRHFQAMEELRDRNRELEEQLAASCGETVKLEQELARLKQQVETTWATERMANAVLRERINDVAGEVVRVAHALEGLSSPIDCMTAGTASELLSLPPPSSGNTLVPSISTGGEDSKGSLAYRIRSLQKRAARVASNGGT
jgi:predicted  nucleic acid-binding Zn-ribbon protein